MTPQQLPFTQDRRRRVEHAARDYHRDNPGVLPAVIEIAREAKARGYRTWSINGVFEVLRWSRKFKALRLRLGVKDGESFALNNSHRAFFARLAMETAPDLQGFFVTRKLRSE